VMRGDAFGGGEGGEEGVGGGEGGVVHTLGLKTGRLSAG
jgi:hypothetical protein